MWKAKILYQYKILARTNINAYTKVIAKYKIQSSIVQPDPGLDW